MFCQRATAVGPFVTKRCEAASKTTSCCRGPVVPVVRKTQIHIAVVREASLSSLKPLRDLNSDSTIQALEIPVCDCKGLQI